MTALTANVSSSATEFPMDAAPPPPGSTWTVGTENIIVRGGQALPEGPHGRPTPSAGIQPRRWIVERGYAGTTAASHLSGATLTRYYVDAPASGGGGGSISATAPGGPTVDPVTSFTFPVGIVSEGDPGEVIVGPGTLRGSADPTASGGTVAEPGSIYQRDNGELWLKYGTAATDWLRVPVYLKSGANQIFISSLSDAQWSVTCSDTSGNTRASMTMDMGPGLATLSAQSADISTASYVYASETDLTLAIVAPSGGRGVFVDAAGVHIGTDASGPLVLAGSADPSAGGGVAAPRGSQYLRDTGAVGQAWVKTGTGDTAWTNLTP